LGFATSNRLKEILKCLNSLKLSQIGARLKAAAHTAPPPGMQRYWRLWALPQCGFGFYWFYFISKPYLQRQHAVLNVVCWLEAQFITIIENLLEASLKKVAMGCPHLTSLNFTSCKYATDAVLEKVATGCQNLTSLDLTDCENVADAGLEKVAADAGWAPALVGGNCFSKIPLSNGDLCAKKNARSDFVVEIQQAKSASFDTYLWLMAFGGKGCGGDT
jgi:hypothetical protein